MSRGWTRREALFAAAFGPPALLGSGCWREPDDKLRYRHWLTTAEARAAALEDTSPERLAILRPAPAASPLSEDRRTLDQMRLQWRVLNNVENVDLSVPLFGVSCSSLWVAPHPLRNRLASDGEIRTLRSAGRTGTPMIIDGSSDTALPGLAAERAAPVAWQLRGDSHEAQVDELSRAAELACIAAVFATKGSLPMRDELGSFELLAAGTKVPILARGDIDANSAPLWLDAGASGLMLSNAESGWDLSTSAVASQALPGVVDAVDARVPVLFEGDVRCGIDALKALALGAAAVAVGQPVLWGLAAASTEGVHRVLSLLQRELGTAMGLCGSSKPGQLQPGLVRKAPWASA